MKVFFELCQMKVIGGPVFTQGWPLSKTAVFLFLTYCNGFSLEEAEELYLIVLLEWLFERIGSEKVATSQSHDLTITEIETKGLVLHIKE